MSRRALYWTLGVLLALLAAGVMTFDQLMALLTPLLGVVR